MSTSFSRLPALGIVAVFAMAASAAVAFVREATERIESIARFAIAVMFDALARPFSITPRFDRPATAGGPFSYDAPPIHGLRHEAGVSRRSAARHT